MANKNGLAALSVAQLRARRRRLARRVGDPAATLRGSLILQGRRCGKPGCRCAAGELHGPYVYLSVGRTTGGPRLLYVPASLVEVVRERVDVTDVTEAVLAEISAINLELLTRRELDR
jgi:hypothetical protein